MCMVGPTGHSFTVFDGVRMVPAVEYVKRGDGSAIEVSPDERGGKRWIVTLGRRAIFLLYRTRYYLSGADEFSAK